MRAPRLPIPPGWRVPPQKLRCGLLPGGGYNEALREIGLVTGAASTATATRVGNCVCVCVCLLVVEVICCAFELFFALRPCSLVRAFWADEVRGLGCPDIFVRETCKRCRDVFLFARVAEAQ